jgi:excisionase family DNA binding protein
MSHNLKYKKTQTCYNNQPSKDLKTIFDIQIKKIWRIPEVAEYLGCSKKTVYEKARLGIIPSIKKGKFRYFIPSEVENWLLE